MQTYKEKYICMVYCEHDVIKSNYSDSTLDERMCLLCHYELQYLLSVNMTYI